MNKQRRKEIEFLKYKRRVRATVRSWGTYIDSKGKHKQQPKAVDIINDNGFLWYRSCTVPCSCWMCSGEHKYKRCKQKETNRKLITEELSS